jgi:protein-S-isoprenylcysteine O-methyltransferase Ste14
MPLQVNATMISVRKTLASGAVNFLYWLIMLEGILMATPFGILLYSFYDPFLAGARQSELTAWVAAFFLPQSVYATNSSFIEFMRYGEYLFYIGLAGFFVSAVPVYWAKLTRKGMVSGFIYRYIRHPQYLFFMLSAFGLLFIWPRMMMLVLFLLMSVLYFYLAKFEERRMQSQYPEYAAYMHRTAMFIPGEPGRKLFNLLFGWVPSRNLAQPMAVLSIVVVAIAGAIGLRNLTIANISVAEIPDQRILAISIFPHDQPYLRDAVTKTLAEDAVRNALDAQGNVSFTAHILPKNYGMLGKFVSVNEHHEAEIIRNFRNRLSWKGFLWGTESDDVKIVLSQIDKPGKRFVPLAEILDMSAKMTPILIVDLNLPTGALTNLTITDTTYYGDVPQPIF